MIHRSVFLSLCVICACVSRAPAALLFPSVAERIAGVRIDVAPAGASFSDRPSSLRVEAADAELYGIAGLRSSGVRISGIARRIIVTATLVNVVSPVGTHARAVAEAGVRMGDTWQGALRAGVERLSLDGTNPVDWRVAGLVSRADVGRVTTLADIEVLERSNAYETSMTLATRVRAGAAHLVANVVIDGDRFVGAGISIVARLHESLALLAGYDDGAQSMRAGAVIDWRGIEIATGVFQHPVLGMSQAVSVACFR